MDLELTGKRVVVTGAGRGIGLAVTRGFVAEGAHVVAGSRATSPELEELANAGSVTPSRSTSPRPTAPASWSRRQVACSTCW